ncbi:glycogen synthase kinase 3 beta [Nematocida parisii]|uniref:CMGC/GSK protein kinase n=1 Tax=Nematocida parisii (strain ERTm3) TaxID=935791 RepID=I3EEJ0_NEMP3|nr:CMGC/GSK protein kinase [Nematocida parisii ERTm1]EIJ87637.1 CMGC/GSK protein kinase [Nematocida parisii ERTm3]KAI5128990.1 glycogen synthase kinase 3 beta [Nematocida parisii]EIJ92865.1 CMGC/GSK protein kinase [Nematocida parisii ERTm1]KAI5129181.1 glycogen synthase kinase 3 beta [Nematocida parisii]KAI5142075.1 glycogen synthase kinase 3 beta [Nematocida parisii]|eukprot:XP_013060091.1 CMGC/GSK protein kinase [Nematocida parisii ERTm1]
MYSRYMLEKINEGERKCLEEQMICAVTGQQTPIKYYALQKIGIGTFGLVYRIVVDGSLCYALKCVFEKKTHMNRELEMHQSLSHPNIVRLIWYFYGERNENGVFLNLVMEYVRSDLFSKIQERYVFSKDEFINYSIMLLDALSYMHACGIAHRDIKPSNILIDTEKALLKVCDLGSAKNIINCPNNILYICSRYYRAPEIHLKQKYGMGIDVWSAGCVLFEMVVQEALFPGDTAEDCLTHIENLVLKDGLSQIIYSTGRSDLSDCFRILRKMIAYDPSRRISASDALKYFKELQLTENLWKNVSE